MVSVSIHGIWLSWLLVIFLGHLRMSFPQDTQVFFFPFFYHKIYIFYMDSWVWNFWLFELISGMHVFICQYHRLKHCPQAGSLEAPRLIHVLGQKKKTSLTNQSIPFSCVWLCFDCSVSSTVLKSQPWLYQSTPSCFLCFEYQRRSL